MGFGISREHMRYFRIMLWIFLLDLVHITLANGGPRMESSEYRLKIEQGKSVILPCIVYNMDPEKYKVRWYTPSKSLISMNDRKVSSDHRIELLQPYPTDWNIRITGVRRSDSGMYICHLNTQPEQIKRVQLHVQVPPTIRSSGDSKVKLGDRLLIYCNVTADPPANITWFKNDNVLLGYQSEALEFAGVTMDDGGNYRCEADNGIGMAVHETISVEILFAPTVQALVSKIYQSLRKDTVLSCKVFANPTATLSWYKEHHAIKPSWKHIYKNYTSTDESVTHTMQIVSLERFDFADYICVAKNTVGSQSALIKVYEIKEPTTTITYPHWTTTTKPQTESKTPPSYVIDTTKKQTTNGNTHDNSEHKEDGTTGKMAGSNSAPLIVCSLILQTVCLPLTYLVLR